jgi:hypothetical protein
MLKMVWGVFSILAGFSSAGAALSLYYLDAELRAMSHQFGMAVPVSPSDTRSALFFLILAAIFFLVGSFLVKSGDDDRHERLIADLQQLVLDHKPLPDYQATPPKVPEAPKQAQWFDVSAPSSPIPPKPRDF